MSFEEASHKLRVQIPVAGFMLTLIATLILEAAFYLQVEGYVDERKLEKLRHDQQLVQPIFAQIYEQAVADIVFLSQSNETKKLINSFSVDNKIPTEDVIVDIQNLFFGFLKVRPDYKKIRFVSSFNEGAELVSVVKNSSGISAIPKTQLQKRIEEDYISELLNLKMSSIFFSDIALSRNYGKIDLPHQPVFQVAIPVFSTDHPSAIGAVVLDVDFGKVVSMLETDTLQISELFLANSSGDFLSHTDSRKEFGFDKGSRYLMQDEFPILKDKLQQYISDYEFVYADKNAMYSRINVEKYGSDKPLHMVLIYQHHRDQAPLKDLQSNSFIVAILLIIIVLGLSFFASRRLIQPLSRMTDSVQNYEITGKIEHLPVQSKDEIGVLARSFQNLAKKIEEKSRQQQEITLEAEVTSARMEAILNSAADAIITINCSGEVLSFNQAAERIFGYTEQQILHQPVNTLMPSPYADEHDEYLHRYITTGKSSIIGNTRELTGLRRNGEKFPIELSVTELGSTEERIFTGIIRDISLRKQLETEREDALEKAQTSARLKSEFVASMSHEIRTPMNGVIGMLGLMLRGELSKQQHRYATLARSSANSLLTLINDILDFSKIEAGKLELEIIDFDLRSQLGEFAESIAQRAQEKGLELVLDLSGVTESSVRGDSGRLRQILTNLVGNAIKFTDSGEVIITASLEFNKEHPEQLLLNVKVSDTGIGIPAEKLDTLFDSFTQVDASTTRKYGGTGLGLTITKQLCELMQGRIQVTSQYAQGSCFEFTVVLERGQVSETVMPRLNTQGIHILIVDDNQTNREVLRAQLECWGVIVTEADSGAAAWVKLEKHLELPGNESFPVALLDMQMPEMNGADLAKKIRADQRFDSTQLILMTSIGEQKDGKYFAELGFAAYFLKPMTTTDLYDALAVVLEGGNSLQVADPLVTHHHLQSMKAQSGLKGAHILLVEDNRVNQEVALGILGEIDVCADVAGNGVEAIAALKSMPEDAPYKLILMDCQMPEMDGYEATRQIRNGAATELYSSIPIIAMTANAMKGDEEKCLSAGMSDYITKPVDPDKLANVLCHWLSSQRATDQTITAISSEAEADVAKQVPDNPECESDTPVWDHASVLKRVRGKEERLIRLIDLFLENRSERMDSLGKAIDTQNMEEIAGAAHLIKGVAANLSALSVQTLTGEIEAAAKEGDIEVIQSCWSELCQQDELLLTCLEQYLLQAKQKQQA